MIEFMHSIKFILAAIVKGEKPSRDFIRGILGKDSFDRESLKFSYKFMYEYICRRFTWAGSISHPVVTVIESLDLSSNLFILI